MRLLLFTIFLAIAAGCSESDPELKCVEPSNALVDISSLSNIVNNDQVAGRPTCVVYSGATIETCLYEGQRTYFFSNAPSSIDVCGFIAYDCHGEEIINRGSNSEAWDAFEEDRVDVQLLWTKP